MINKDEFNSALLKSGVSINEFARKIGKTKAVIVSYTKMGVPDRDESFIKQMLNNAGKKIFFGEQMDIEEGL